MGIVPAPLAAASAVPSPVVPRQCLVHRAIVSVSLCQVWDKNFFISYANKFPIPKNLNQ